MNKNSIELNETVEYDDISSLYKEDNISKNILKEIERLKELYELYHKIKREFN